MESLRILLAPLYAAGLLGLVIAAFTFGRRNASTRPLHLQLVWFGLLAAGSLLLVLQTRDSSALALPTTSLVRAASGVLLVVAAWLAVRGTRVRSRADVLRACVPVSLDEAVAALRSGREPGWGVYQGRLESSEALTSPGGVPCAFYEAQIRSAGQDGRKGPLLSRVRAYSSRLLLRGERVQASVRFTPSSLLAPMQVRQCQAAPGAVPASWYEEADSLPDTGGRLSAASSSETLSWEKAGVLGEPCVVVGRLQRVGEGAYEVVGRKGGPALLVLGAEAPRTGGVLARDAWRHFAAAGALSVAAAFVLAQAL